MLKTGLLSAVLAAGFGSLAYADTVPLQDPLHIECTGCIDNGTNTPLPTSTSTFGFSSSPPGQTGTLVLEVLVPDTVNLGTFVVPSISGFASGTPSLFSATAWTTGTVNAYLGGAYNVNASPDNTIGAYLPSTQALDGNSVTGFFDFLFNAGSVTGMSGPGVFPANEDFTLGGNLPLGSYVIAMLLTTDKKGNAEVINTANSGAGFVNTTNTVPLPGAIWLMAGGLGLVGLAGRRRRERSRAR